MANAKTSSNAISTEEIGFWDAHDGDEHWDATRDAAFRIVVNAERSYFAVESEAEPLRAAATRRGDWAESQVSDWLQERLAFGHSLKRLVRKRFGVRALARLERRKFSFSPVLRPLSLSNGLKPAPQTFFAPRNVQKITHNGSRSEPRA